MFVKLVPSERQRRGSCFKTSKTVKCKVLKTACNCENIFGALVRVTQSKLINTCIIQIKTTTSKMHIAKLLMGAFHKFSQQSKCEKVVYDRLQFSDWTLFLCPYKVKEFMILIFIKYNIVMSRMQFSRMQFSPNISTIAKLIIYNTSINKKWL